jgi:hypothetical protein
MSDVTDNPDDRLTLRQPEQPRPVVHVDLYSISRDLKTIKHEIARRPARGEILRLALGCLAAVVVALLLIR